MASPLVLRLPDPLRERMIACAEIGRYETVSHFARSAIERLCDTIESPTPPATRGAASPSSRPNPPSATTAAPCPHPAQAMIGTLCTQCGEEVIS